MSKSSKINYDPEGLTTVPSQKGEVHDVPTCTHDVVFGTMTEDGPNYRDVGWLGTSALMMKTQIGLGVLSIPTAFHTLGIVPGVICMCTIAAITTWSDYMIGVFKLRHPEVYNIDDAGFLMFGKIGREVFAVAFVLFWTFCAGSGMLGFSIGLNAVSTHGTCTAVFVVVAAVIAFCLASIRTLGRISWLAWVGVICIIVSIMILTIAVGVQDRPASAPKEGPWIPDYKITNNPPFTEAITAISTLIFAYAGTPAFFSIASEMRDPRHYTRALLLCQGVVTALYIAVGCVVYYFCGSYVASPALGSAGRLMKKICYGIALPSLMVGAVLVIHISAKYIFVRILRDSKHLAANTFTHWATWLGCTFGITVSAYLIASGIPVFNGLVSLIGALFGTLMSFQPMGCMWLYENWSSGKSNPSWQWTFMAGFSIFVIVSGTFLMVAGTYGSTVSIIDSYKEFGGSGAWSCADNSNSV